MFGMVTGVVNIFGFFVDYQWILWLAFYVLGGMLLSKKVDSKLFFNSFICGFLFAAFYYGLEILSFPMYLENNPQAREMMTALPEGVTPRMFAGSMGLLISVMNGVIFGLVTVGMTNFFKKKELSAGK